MTDKTKATLKNIGGGIITVAFFGFIGYGMMPKEEKKCAYIEWNDKGAKDTFYFYAQVSVKGKDLVNIYLEQDTIFNKDLSIAPSTKGRNITATDKKGNWYSVDVLKKGKCECDSVMDLYYDGKLPEEDQSEEDERY